MKTERNRASNAWRVASAFVSMGLLAWGLAAVAYVNTSSAKAEASPQFHAVDAHFLVPQNGEWFNVAIEMLVLDNGTGTFEQDVETARAEMLDRFPGAVVLPDGHETADGEFGSLTSPYVLSGFKWMSNSSNWGYDGTGAPSSVSGSAMSAMMAAASTWGSQGTPFSFQGGAPSSAGTGACGGGGTNGSNTVGWGNQSGSVLAVTCSWFETNGNPRPAIEFDMQFDPDWSWSTGGSGVDLQSVALHEFGHAAGLNHSASGSAVMFASYTSGTTKRVPTQDDINGLQAIYGGGSSNPTNTPPAATNTPTRTATPTRTPTNVPTQPGGGQNTPTPPLATSTPTKTPTQPTGGGGPNNTATPVPPTKTPTTGPGSPTATNTPTATPTRAATVTPTPGNSLPILPGANLMAWPGGDMAPAQALANVQNLRVVYSYDAATGNWTRYVPGAPSFLNNLQLLKKGGSYWFIATGSAQVPFQP